MGSGHSLDSCTVQFGASVALDYSNRKMHKPLEIVIPSIAFDLSMRPQSCHRNVLFAINCHNNIKLAKSYHSTLWFSSSAKSRHFFCNWTFCCKMRFVTSSRHVGWIADIFVTNRKLQWLWILTDLLRVAQANVYKNTLQILEFLCRLLKSSNFNKT